MTRRLTEEERKNLERYRWELKQFLDAKKMEYSYLPKNPKKACFLGVKRFNNVMTIETELSKDRASSIQQELNHLDRILSNKIVISDPLISHI